MHPHKIDLDPIVNTWPSNDYYDDDETLKASVLQAGSLSSSVPPLSGIRHRPGDNQNVDYLGYLDYLDHLDHLGNNQNVDYLEVALMRMMLTVMKKKMIVTLYN